MTAENANKVVERVTKGNRELDFLSIDVDGNDIYLFGALSVRPRVVCIEYNAKFPPDISKQQKYDPSSVWSGTDYMGSSLKAISDLAGDLGYRLVGTNLRGATRFLCELIYAMTISR